MYCTCKYLHVYVSTKVYAYVYIYTLYTHANTYSYSTWFILPIGSMYGIDAIIWGILMGSMAHHIYPYIAAPWIRHGLVKYISVLVFFSTCPFVQWPFQDPKLEVPTIYKAYIRPM